MKTVFKTLTDSRQANQKRRVFEARTGLKWDYYRTGQGMGFTPIATKETPINEDAAAALLPHLTKRAIGFVKLAETSGIELITVVSGAWTLVKAGKAVGVVNRLGHFAGIYSNAKPQAPDANIEVRWSKDKLQGLHTVQAHAVGKWRDLPVHCRKPRMLTAAERKRIEKALALNMGGRSIKLHGTIV